MNSERLVDLVAAALELPPAERAPFLRRVCDGDPTLLGEALSLAEHGDEAFLAQPAYRAVGDGALIGLKLGKIVPGTVVGECRIVALLGEGGMGEVYLAEDTKLERRVAVKLLKRSLDEALLLRRFRHERRVLAGLTHPNVARLYDGGVTPDGQAYLVMEYVEGERLDHYCQDHGLDVGERLALFRKVCAAVAYAHQNLVVHRDLKPANIRVTAEGEPKLLDFGIAKLLDPEGTTARPDPTVTMQGAMTPEYASPEQLRGEPITTSSDVYSLGVVLYELLCGQRPFAHLKGRRPDELARAVCEEEPPRPSTVAGQTAPMTTSKLSARQAPATRPSATRLRRQLEGDLDNIVAKALRKEPARRYPSVLALSEDIRRYCEGLPVTARKDTLTYRACKFIHRNKAGVAGAALVLIALLGGLAATTWQAHAAGQERDRAQQERDRAQQARTQAEAAERQAERINEFLQQLLASAAPSKMGKDVKMIQVLDAAGADLDQKLADEPAVLAQIHRTLGNTYVELGLLQAAETHYRAAVTLLRQLYGSDAEPTMSAEIQLGGTLSSENRYADGETLLRHSLAWVQRQPRDKQGQLPTVLSNLSFCLMSNHQTEAAEAMLNEALARIAKDQGTETVLYFRTLGQLGTVKRYEKDSDAAATVYRRAVAGLKRVAPDYRGVVINQLNLCLVLIDQGKFAEAATEWEMANRDCLRIMGANNMYHLQVVYIAEVLDFARGDFKKVVAEGKEILERFVATYPKNDGGRVTAHYLLGSSLTLTGHAAEGEPWLREALAQYDPTGPAFLFVYGNIETALGDCLLSQKRYAEAEPLLLTGHDELEKRLGPQDRLTIEATHRLHDFYLARNEPAETVRFAGNATAQSLPPP